MKGNLQWAYEFLLDVVDCLMLGSIHSDRQLFRHKKLHREDIVQYIQF